MIKKLFYNFILLGIILFSTSCNPCVRLAKKCPPRIIIKDSIVTEICYRDTVIYDTIRLRYDTIIERIVYKNLDNELTTDLSYIKGNISKSTAQVIRGVLRHDLQENDTIIQFNLDSALKRIKTTNTHTEYKEVVIEKFKTKSYDYALRYYFVITMILLTLYVIKKRF